MSRESGFNSEGSANKSNWEKFEDKIMSNVKPEQNSGSVASEINSVEDKISLIENGSNGAMIDNGEIPPRPTAKMPDKKSDFDPVKYLEETSTGYLVDNGELPPGGKKSDSIKQPEVIDPIDYIEQTSTQAMIDNGEIPSRPTSKASEIKSDIDPVKYLEETSTGYLVDNGELPPGLRKGGQSDEEQPKKPEPLQITHQEYDPNKVPALINEVKGVPAVIEDPEEPKKDEELKQIPHIPYDPSKVPALIPKEPTPPETPKSIKLRGSIVDSSDAIKRARHISDAELTASRDEMRGFIELGQKCYQEKSLPSLKELSTAASGTVKKIWRFGMMRYWTGYRSELGHRQEMREQEDYYTDQSDSKLALSKDRQAISLRFLDKFDEALHAGEVREQLGESEAEQSVKQELIFLMKRYAADEIDEEVFNIEKYKVFSQLRDERGDVLTRGLFYADNILELAKQVKEMDLHGEALEALNIELDITLGRARTGARTEAQLNACDYIIETMRNNRLGFVNESTVAAGTAAAILTGANIIGTRAARSRLLMLGTFGASAAVGGVIGGMREGHQIESERAQHMREVAEGKKFSPGSRRREIMNEYIHEMRPATEMTAELENYLDGRELTEEEIFSAIQLLGQINARVELSDSRCIDLIAFSDVTEVETERQKLDSARGRLRHELKKLVPDLDSSLRTQVDLQSDRLINGTDTETGIIARDESFRGYKNMRERWAAGLGAIMGGTIGASLAKLSEVAGDTMKDYAGQASEWVHSRTGFSVGSALDTLRSWLGVGKSAETEVLGLMKEIKIGDSLLRLPDGAALAPDAEGSGYSFMYDGRTVCSGLEFNSDGSFTPDSLSVLQDHGVDIETEIHAVTSEVQEEVIRSAKEFVDAHKEDMVDIARSRLNSNGTPYSDGNELRFDWGGVNNTGVDSDGKIVMSVERMTPEGSSNNGVNEDITKLIAEGKAKLAISMSMGTQKQVFFADLMPDGTAHIDPSIGGPGSAFEVVDGRAVFNGAMVEVVAVEDGVNDLGEKVVSVFSTLKGEGYKTDGVFKDIGITLVAHDTVITTLGEPTVEAERMSTVFPIPTGRRPLESENEKKDKSSEDIDDIEEETGESKNSSDRNKEEKEQLSEKEKEKDDNESDDFDEDTTEKEKKLNDYKEKEKQINEMNRYGMLDERTFAWFENGKVKKLTVPESINLELKQSYTNSQFGPVILAEIFHDTDHLKGFVYVNKGEPWFVPSKNGIKVSGEFISLKDKFEELL